MAPCFEPHEFRGRGLPQRMVRPADTRGDKLATPAHNYQSSSRSILIILPSGVTSTSYFWPSLRTFTSYLTLPFSRSISAESSSLFGNRFLIAVVTGLGSRLMGTFSWKVAVAPGLGSRLIGAFFPAHAVIWKATATIRARAIREKICNIMFLLSKPKQTTLGHNLCHGVTAPQREAKASPLICMFSHPFIHGFVADSVLLIFPGPI